MTSVVRPWDTRRWRANQLPHHPPEQLSIYPLLLYRGLETPRVHSLDQNPDAPLGSSLGSDPNTGTEWASRHLGFMLPWHHQNNCTLIPSLPTCLCQCACACTHMCAGIQTCARTHTCMHPHVQVYTRAHACVHIHTRIHSHSYMHAHVRNSLIHACMHTCARIHASTHSHTYTCMHAHTSTYSFLHRHTGSHAHTHTHTHKHTSIHTHTADSHSKQTRPTPPPNSSATLPAATPSTHSGGHFC